MLRKNYKITRTDRTEYGDYPNQATSYIVEENTASISVPATKSINGKTLPFGGWYDISGNNLTPTENMTLIALYKDLHITNSNNQFSNGSQNRFLRSSVSGYYHLVYESMGKIWYEISTDGGTTWYLANGGKSVSDKPARNPSLAVAPNGLVGIVYQSQNIEDNELYDIKFSYFSEGGTKFYDIMVQEGGPSGGFPDPYYQNANPVCSFTSSSLILFAWSDITAGTILYRLGSTNSSTLINNFIWLMEESNWISSQYIIKNPSLTGFPHNYSSATEGAFYLAFEEKISDASTKIKFKKIPVQYSNSIGAYITMPATFISMASGYEKNFYPSIAVNPSNKDDYRVACLSEGSSGKKASYYGYGSAGGGYTFSAGTYVGSVNMKIVNNEAIMGWSNYYTSSCQFAQLGYPYYYTKNLNINGYVQISGGASLSNTRAISLVASSAPCTFALSNSLNTLSKNSPDSTSEGKNLIIAKGDAEYVFGVHNAQLNGNKISFNKDIRFNEESRLLETTPFTAGLQSSIVFRIKSGKIAPDSIIINPDEYLYFNLDLVDKNTGAVIRNLYKTGNMAADAAGLNYKDILIDLSGLSGKELTLRLSADVNMDSCRFTESVELNEPSGYDLAKAEKITIDEETTPTVYALSQNYPNPFNPSTVIS
ncbi:MAG TPA: hypothetical protein VHP30_11825, partial [Ignavibacteriales bacterium]|nr:hypothetical protein [Ignavibacteriales bacterium]